MPKQKPMPPSARSKKVKALQTQILELRAQLASISRGEDPGKKSGKSAARQGLNSKSKSKGPVNTHLTDREREVLKLTVEEYVAREIAKKLKIGVRTVESYRASLLKKLGCRSLVGLTRYAISNGIVPL